MTTRRLILVLCVLVFATACALFTGKPGVPMMPGMVIMEAQSLPITKTLSWTDADATITGYSVTLDGVVIGTPTVKSQSVTFTTLGNHTLIVTALNTFGATPSAPLVVVVQLPTAPTALTIQ